MVSKMENGWKRNLFKFLSALIAVNADVGALSSIYGATVKEVPEFMKGGTIDAGPKVGPFPWSTKAFTPENCTKLFDSVNKVIESKGYKGFQ
eukprot:gene42599-52835_t